MNYIYYLLCAITGGVLSTANVTLSNWRFWVILGCVIGAYVCGRVNGG